MNGVPISENDISLICELVKSEPYIIISANDPSYIQNIISMYHD